jgi:hypothetical protein
MAVTNTGIVLRTITGVNESDLFLDSESTSVATNTGIVERSVVGVHDANFVHPLGDEEIINGGFDQDSNWSKGVNWTIDGGKAVSDGSIDTYILQSIASLDLSKTYKVEITCTEYTGGSLLPKIGSSGFEAFVTSSGSFTYYGSFGTDATIRFYSSSFVGSIDNVSIKEMLVNRESTTTNTGIVERSLTGVNESDLWLDSESTSVVNNTGIVERPITGVNESDPMFPDNTISTITNI